MSFYAAEERERQQKRAEISIGALPPITPQKKGKKRFALENTRKASIALFLSRSTHRMRFRREARECSKVPTMMLKMKILFNLMTLPLVAFGDYRYVSLSRNCSFFFSPSLRVVWLFFFASDIFLIPTSSAPLRNRRARKASATTGGETKTRQYPRR